MADAKQANMIITEIAELIALSKMSELHVQQHVLKAERAYPPYSTINEENASINRVVYGLLNEKQRSVFDKIHQHLSIIKVSESDDPTNSNADSNTVAMLIDAPSGTGKTWLLMTLLIMMRKQDTNFVVYQRSLAHSAESITGVSAYTCVQYLKTFMRIPHDDMRSYLKEESSLLDMIRKIIRPKVHMRSGKLIILDEYTVVSPWYLLRMYWLAKLNGACILYCGDRYSLSSMDRCNSHDENNYTIVDALTSSPDVKFEDLDQERIRDRVYENKVKQFKEILRGSQDNLRMSLDIKVKLYSIFEKHFQMETDITATYLAQFHEDLYTRAYDICNYYETRGIKCYRSPYYSDFTQSGRLEIESLQKSQTENRANKEPKFLEFLPLIRDYVYYHVKPMAQKSLVKYIGKVDGNVIVQDINTGLKEALSLQPIFWDYCVKEEYNWLMKENGNREPYQYPLRLRLRTYHSIQGHSIQRNEKVELNIDVENSNCVYVGLSHIQYETQLGRLHTNDSRFLKILRTSDKEEESLKKEKSLKKEESVKSPLVKLAMYLRDVKYSELMRLVEESEDSEESDENRKLEEHINRYLTSIGETPLMANLNLSSQF